MRLLLLGLVLGGRGAAAFVVQLWGSCALASNGSTSSFTLRFNGAPLVCSEPAGALPPVPCAAGLLQGVATALATALGQDSTWMQRTQEQERTCASLSLPSALRSVPPQARVTSSASGDAVVPVLLTCHVWGFYPPDVTVLWLHNGDIVNPGDKSPSLVPNGDLTYQTQLTLMVAPAHGDTFTCSVQHPSLEQPLLVDWGPGLSPELTVKVVAAALVLVLGLSIFAVGVHHYRDRSRAPGYTPLAGDTHPTAGSI